MFYNFDSDHAEKFGVNEAIVLYNFIYWLKKNHANNDNFHDNNWWTYNSAKALKQLFPFWSVDQVKRIIKSLVTQGVLIIGNYNNSKYDQTNWYALSPEYLYFIDSAKSPNGKSDTTQSSLSEIALSLNKTDNKPTDNKQEIKKKKDKPQDLIFDLSDFTCEEQTSIKEWLDYKEQIGKPHKTQISYTKLRNKLLDLKRRNILILMIDNCIEKEWSGLYEDKILTTAYQKHAVKEAKPGNHPAPEYVIAETKEQKRDLANYIEACYRNKIDPRTGKKLSASQAALISQHLHRAKSAYEYIYSNEVLTGICLLDQDIEGAVA